MGRLRKERAMRTAGAKAAGEEVRAEKGWSGERSVNQLG